MKNRQFIILCILIVLWFGILIFKLDNLNNKIDKNQDVLVENTSRIIVNSEWYLEDIFHAVKKEDN